MLLWCGVDICFGLPPLLPSSATDRMETDVPATMKDFIRALDRREQGEESQAAQSLDTLAVIQSHFKQNVQLE